MTNKRTLAQDSAEAIKDSVTEPNNARQWVKSLAESAASQLKRVEKQPKPATPSDQ